MQDNRHDHEMDNSLDELRDLLADFTTGELTDTQNMRLEQLVLASKAHRRFYIQYMHMYGTIHQEHCHTDKNSTSMLLPADNVKSKEPENAPPASNGSNIPLLDIENDLLSQCCDIDEFVASTKPNLNNGPLDNFFGRINFDFVPGLIMIVASTLILSTVVILPIYWSIRSEDSQWSAVARITRTVDCYFSQDETCPREGVLLPAGQLLDLEVGLVEIEFTSGAKVILEGPAQFIVTGDNNSQLDFGQLAAVVPKGAEGFTVGTPGMEVVDLGTEFGVAVTAEESADVHVFKGAVETEIDTNPGKQKKVRLKKNEAIEFDKKSGDLVPIPINKKKFIRDIDRKDGVIANLRVTNPSFELPDIRTVSEYQAKHGNTLFRPIYGWRISDHNQTRSTVAMYQISPYTSLLTDDCNVGPGATDGRQVATISLGVKPAPVGKPRFNWIYQSLGVVTPADVGKKLKLSVDAGPRSKYGNSPQGNGTVFAAFALQVNATQSGTVLGKAACFHETGEIKQLHRLETSMSITAELVGQELFILLAVSDDGSSREIEQYHFDNVEVVTQD